MKVWSVHNPRQDTVVSIVQKCGEKMPRHSAKFNLLYLLEQREKARYSRNQSVAGGVRVRDTSTPGYVPTARSTCTTFTRSFSLRYHRRTIAHTHLHASTVQNNARVVAASRHGDHLCSISQVHGTQVISHAGRIATSRVCVAEPELPVIVEAEALIDSGTGSCAAWGVSAILHAVS